MDNLLLHDHSRLQLQALLSDPPHALLLLGPNGIGKFTVARAWGRQLAPHTEVITPDDKGTIPIDAIRALYRRTRSRQATHQVIIVDHAEAMGAEAQNAFLKLLEEPRSGVTFVLTAPTHETLLPTISSRLQSVHLQLIAKAALQTWAATQATLDPQSLAQLLFVAAGRPGIATQLITNPSIFSHHRALMQTAKQLLAGKPYDRLALIPALTKNRDDLIATLEALAHMLTLQIRSKPDATLMHFADGLQICLARLAQNGNARAQLTALFVVY